MKEDIVHFYVPQIKVPFYMEMAGISYCDGTYRMKRQDSAETVLEYIVEGRGYLNVDGENYAATKGDVYILRKKTTHTYWSDAKSPWVKIFFDIRGSLAEKDMSLNYHKAQVRSHIMEEVHWKTIAICAILVLLV